MGNTGQEQRGRLAIIEAELKDVRRRLDRLWAIVESTDDDLADTATPRIRANRDRQVRLEVSLQEANAILSQRRAIRDDVAIMTAKAQDMTEFPEKSELPERCAGEIGGNGGFARASFLVDDGNYRHIPTPLRKEELTTYICTQQYRYIAIAVHNRL